MKIFRINDEFSVVCEYQNTRTGFRHVATLCIDGTGYDEAKCTYQNRTWERYTYESVLQKLFEKCKDGKRMDEMALMQFADTIKAGV